MKRLTLSIPAIVAIFLGIYTTSPCPVHADTAEPLSLLSGRISSEDGDAVSDATVIAVSKKPGSSYEGISGLDGRYFIEVPDGTYDLEVLLKGSAAIPTATAEVAGSTTQDIQILETEFNTQQSSPAEISGTDECTVHPDTPISVDGKWHVANGCGSGCVTTGGPAPQLLCPRHADEACMEVKISKAATKRSPNRYKFSVYLNPCTQDASTLNRYRVEFTDEAGTERSIHAVSWSDEDSYYYVSRNPRITNIYHWR